MIDQLELSTYEVPTDAPEADGTLAWKKTVLVVVEVCSGRGGPRGLGYTYANAAAAHVIHDALEKVVVGSDEMATERTYERMVQRVRNVGQVGIAAMALSAVDVALWDLKAKLLGVPLYRLLGAARDAVAVYGSGGFTSYDDARLASQLAGWAGEGLRMVKMKIGGDVREEVARVRTARDAIGDEVELFVDANGAYAPKEALRMAEALAPFDVRWFEEPVSSDDLAGLRLVRERAPVCMDVAAGEYAWGPLDADRMLAAEAVDVLQVDVTRVGGVSGFARVAAIADARGVPLSAHCAPALHVHLGCALPRVRHLEWFHDHVRIERMLFDGAPVPESGRVRPDPTRPGHGLDLRRADAKRFALAG